jgi:Zn-dependent protease
LVNQLPSFPPARPTPPSPPSDHPKKREVKGILGILATIGVVILKFGAKLKYVLLPIAKFFPLVLKTGGTMLLTIGAYTMLWGWKFAVGFVLLLLVHECGHLVVAKKFGLKVGAPVFIPFMGAFIALKEAPRNAWMEAWVGIGGPLLGSAGALLCHSAGETFEWPLLIALAWTGYWLNLFNLTPIGTLDGGRIVTALSPWLWIPGLAIMGYMAFTHSNFIIWLVLFMSIPRIISLFRKRTSEEQRYFEVTPAQRWQMGAMYFGLIGALVYMMDASHRELDHIHRQPTKSRPSVIAHASPDAPSPGSAL